MQTKTKETLINIGSGVDFTITEYAKKILTVLKVDAKIKYNKSKPNGTPKKLLDVSLAKKYGWKTKTTFEDGVLLAYKSFINNK